MTPNTLGQTDLEISRADEAHVPEMVECWKELADFHAAPDTFYERPPEEVRLGERHAGNARGEGPRHG